MRLKQLACTLDGRWRTVIDLMGSLKEEAGLVPTASSYNVVIEALAKAGEWMKALEMLEEMKQERVRPTEFTYSRCMAGSPIILAVRCTESSWLLEPFWSLCYFAS